MKPKTIKKILRAKINEWLDSITDPALRSHLKTHCLVTGGAIASMLLDERVNDYDVYLTDFDTARRVAEYYVAQLKQVSANRFANSPTQSGALIPITIDCRGGRVRIKVQSQGIASESGTNLYQYFELTGINDPSAENFVADVTQVIKSDDPSTPPEPRYRPVFMSSNAITLSDGVQIVLRFFGSAAEIHKNYDFVHCTCVWDSADGSLVLPADALECLLTRELRYAGSLYPICSIIRTRKFQARGFTITAAEFLKMCFQISKLDLSSVDVLEDQLTGVDSAYFRVLIDALRSKVEKDPTFVPNYLYICEILDRIF